MRFVGPVRLVLIGAILPLIPAAGQPGGLGEEWRPAWLEGLALEPTYAGGVGLIVEHRCLGCHRPGGASPMSFTSYEEIRRWASATNTPMLAVIQTRAMPPWPADPGVGEFANATYLTPPEMALLEQWIADGYPRGEGDYAPPPLPADGWPMGSPDRIIELPEITLPAEQIGGVVDLTIPIEGDTERWVLAAELRLSNEINFLGLDGGPLGRFRPGALVDRAPPGFGRLLRPGEPVAVRIRYAKPGGTEVVDRPTLGLFFARETAGLRATRQDPVTAPPFSIAPGTSDHVVSTLLEFPGAAAIVSLQPTMGLRGKSVKYRAVEPDGTQHLLLDIPLWQPQWMYRYVLKTPLRVAGGTVIVAVARFDNSAANPKNPDPRARVNSGPDGETFESWIEYVLDEAP